MYPMCLRDLGLLKALLDEGLGDAAGSPTQGAVWLPLQDVLHSCARSAPNDLIAFLLIHMDKA